MVNNDSIKEGKLVVDPYSFQDKTVIHIILNKNDIEDFMKHASLQANEMSFMISPGGLAGGTFVMSSPVANNASVPEFSSSVGAVAVIDIICVILVYRMFIQAKTENSKPATF